MLRLVEMIAVLGLVLSCLLIVPFHHGVALLALLAVAAASLTGVLWARRRAAKERRTLPRGLARLRYRSDEGSVEFRWQRSRRFTGRVRVLRSEERGARDALEAGTGGQLLVYEGAGESWLDTAVKPRHAYHYTLFVSDGPSGWSTPVRVQALTVSPDERRAIEATLQPSAAGAPGGHQGVFTATHVPDPVQDPKGLEWYRGGSAVLGSALGGLATDAVFAVGGLFSRPSDDDGWVEVE
jgi:hypothetical protein